MEKTEGFNLSCLGLGPVENNMPLKRKAGALMSLFDMLDDTKLVSMEDLPKHRETGIGDRPGMMGGDPEDINEGALRGVFSRCGQIEKVYVPLDDQTLMSRGFAFVTYTNRQAGERAVKELNMSKLHNVVLAVEKQTLI